MKIKPSFNPLPRRSYDLNIYRSYPCSVMDKQREKTPSWHCFLVYDDDELQAIQDFINLHQDCECYCKDIYDYDLNEKEADYDYSRK